MIEPSRRSQVPLLPIAILFVVSGAASLVDQICFSKYLSYVVGATAHAVSAVLAAFMTGMALGAYLGGRFAARSRLPLRAYGALELLVALSVAATPLAFGALTPLYVSLVRAAPTSLVLVSAVRWLLAAAVVMVPTTAMGATLPLLARLVEDRPSLRARGRALGILYAANTLGGAVGSIGSAYLVLPALGLGSTTLAAAAASAVVGIAALALSRAGSSSDTSDAPSDTSDAQSDAERDAAVATGGEPTPGAASPTSPTTTSGVLVASLMALSSGALVFACEVIFVHLLVLLVGSSAYAFGVILAIFLTCLFVGASLAPLAERFARDAALALSLGLSAIALTASLPIWEHLPTFFHGVGGEVTTFRGRETVRGTAAFAALSLPTTAMGLTFPLLLQWASRQRGTGSLVGRLTAINTIGAVLGSLATGYLVLPSLGSQRSILAVSAAFAVVALAAAATIGRGGGRVSVVVRVVAAGLAVASVVVGVRAPRWDLAKLTSGYNVYFDYGRGPEDILFVAEDTHGGVTTVTEKGGVHTLLTNGKFQGNDGAEISAQRFFAHYPAMFVHKFDRALVIGLGTGTTLGTLRAYPFEHLEVAEISPSIVEASRRYFGPSGGDALDDPRVTLFHADGRNHLLVSDRRYDLIGIELTSVWFAGASSLYSHEFYRLVRSRLEPDGVLQQWVQLHHISARDFATVVHTLRLEFAHVALFYGGGQGILVSSNAPLVASAARLDALERGLGPMRPDRPLKSLAGDVIATGDGLDAFLGEAAQDAGVGVADLVSTDDNLYLEYATPRGNVLGWSSREELVSRIGAHRDVGAIARMVGP